MARDLVRTRRNIHKFYQMSTQLQAVALRMQTLRSTQQMSEAMRGATRVRYRANQALGSMNRSTNIIAVQRILSDFEHESSTMDMKDEMMGDAMDDALEEEDGAVAEGEESDAILKEVLDEIGVDLGQQVRLSNQLASAPSSEPASAAPARVAISEGAPAPRPASDATDDDLQARLANLRKM